MRAAARRSAGTCDATEIRRLRIQRTGPPVRGAPVGARAGRLLRLNRRGAEADYLVAINHGAEDASLDTSGVDLLTQSDIRGKLVLAGGDVAVVRLPHAADRGDR